MWYWKLKRNNSERERERGQWKGQKFVISTQWIPQFLFGVYYVVCGILQKKIKKEKKKKRGGESLRMDTSQLDLVSSKNY